MSAGDTCAHYVGCPHDVDAGDFAEEERQYAASAGPNLDPNRPCPCGLAHTYGEHEGATAHPSYATIPKDAEDLEPPVQLSHEQANLACSALEAAQAGATYQVDANRYHELALQIRAQQAGR